MAVKPAFQSDIEEIRLADLVPIKTITVAYRKSDTYRRIAASIEHVGIIEPLVVFPTSKRKFLLLDGNTRFDILTSMNQERVRCLIATDNESYTYNRRVNYVPPIAHHYMILKALAHVSANRIAAALNVTVATIREKRDLLKGICPEASELLRNERVPASTFAALRKMKPVRQSDVARVMVSTRKFSGRFARALLDGTGDDLLVANGRPASRLLNPAQRSLIEQETDELLKHSQVVQKTYGNDALALTVACRYVEKLLSNVRIRKYLAKHHDETLSALDELISGMATEKQRRPPAKATAVTRRTAAS